MKEPAGMPHLLFTGPAGVGKTTTALVYVKTITWGRLEERYT